MICEILLPKPIEKTFYYKTLKFLEPGIVVKVEFKNKKDSFNSSKTNLLWNILNLEVWIRMFIEDKKIIT